MYIKNNRIKYLYYSYVFVALPFSYIPQYCFVVMYNDLQIKYNLGFAFVFIISNLPSFFIFFSHRKTFPVNLAKISVIDGKNGSVRCDALKNDS